MRVIDSVGWVEFLSTGDPRDLYASYLLDVSEVITPTIVIYEVYKQMIRIVGEAGAQEAAVQMAKTTIVPLDDSLALLAAELSVKYKLPMADAIIYATAQHYGVTVVTSDKHFEGLPGVEYIPKNQNKEND